MSRTAVSWPVGPGISPDRPAKKKKKKTLDAPLLGFEVFKGIFSIVFKLIFNSKMADQAGGADGRPFLGFN